MPIVACAGSGKTTIMVAHILKLLDQEDVSPENIVAIIYTEKAAASLKNKVYEEYEKKNRNLEGLANMFMGTIHGFCLNMLHSSTEKYKSFQTLNEVQTKLFYKEDTPYIWQTWTYDANYQVGAKRRPFKVIVDARNLKKFKRYVSNFEGEIIACTQMDEFADQYFVIASNPSYKETRVREVIKQYLNNNGCSIQVEYLYGAVEDLPFEIDKANQKLIVRQYIIDKRKYKLEKVMEDLQSLLDNEV